MLVGLSWIFDILGKCVSLEGPKVALVLKILYNLPETWKVTLQIIGCHISLLGFACEKLFGARC